MSGWFVSVCLHRGSRPPMLECYSASHLHYISSTLNQTPDAPMCRLRGTVGANISVTDLEAHSLHSFQKHAVSVPAPVEGFQATLS